MPRQLSIQPIVRETLSTMKLDAGLLKKIADALNDVELSSITGDLVSVDVFMRNGKLEHLKEVSDGTTRVYFRFPPNDEQWDEEMLRFKRLGWKMTVDYHLNDKGQNIIDGISFHP